MEPGGTVNYGSHARLGPHSCLCVFGWLLLRRSLHVGIQFVNGLEVCAMEK